MNRGERLKQSRRTKVANVRKKKDWGSLIETCALPSPTVNQECLTSKSSAVQDAVAALKPITTFAAIGAEIGYSRQYVSKHMQERFRGDPAAMWKIGDDWRIPRGTAEIFIREFFGS
jgi:hypothetical protein